MKYTIGEEVKFVVMQNLTTHLLFNSTSSYVFFEGVIYDLANNSLWQLII